ncbi:MAG: type II secretion system minor pseudopilin GspI [Gammaproteobacteria bacterium]|nr:type II secretion system minor pseudopilin GspI [Gammaproteobacteria bacterium]
MNQCKKNKIAGFTLIEVLIALAILSIALTAIIKATAQNIRDTSYLQDKDIAAWIGTEVINEARVGVLKLPAQPDKIEEEKKVLGQAWKIKAYSIPSPNQKIQELRVDVFRKSDDTKLISLTSYRYVS